MKDRQGADILIGSWTLGFERSTVRLNGEPYLTRYILKLFGRTLRLHKFWRGDDERAFHDHPWPFWTFPLKSYWESVPVSGHPGWRDAKHVRAFRLHRRPSAYQHIVLGPDVGGFVVLTGYKPFWTIVFTGKYERSWGFWPTPDRFVPWREWK